MRDLGRFAVRVLAFVVALVIVVAVAAACAMTALWRAVRWG